MDTFKITFYLFVIGLVLVKWYFIFRDFWFTFTSGNRPENHVLRVMGVSSQNIHFAFILGYSYFPFS